MKVLCVIPARYGSTRLPGKPLALIHGKPVIQRVYERAALARIPDEVLVATDDQRILELRPFFWRPGRHDGGRPPQRHRPAGGSLPSISKMWM